MVALLGIVGKVKNNLVDLSRPGSVRGGVLGTVECERVSEAVIGGRGRGVGSASANGSSRLAGDSVGSVGSVPFFLWTEFVRP